MGSVRGSGFGVWGLGFGVWDSGLGVGGLGWGFGVWGLGSGVWGLGSRVWRTSIAKLAHKIDFSWWTSNDVRSGLSLGFGV